MSGHRPEDWDKHRSEGEHLNDTELEYIRQNARKMTKRAIAQALGCSTRSVQRHLTVLSVGGRPRGSVSERHEFKAGGRGRADPEPKPKAPLPNRHYRSNFEPD